MNNQTHFRETNHMLTIACAGFMESLMSDIADNPPEYFTEEDVDRHREAALKAREKRDRLMNLSEKGGSL